MVHNQEQIGVVVVMENTMVSGLAKLAQRHRWTVIHLPTATRVMKTLGRQRVDIAMVHIAVELQQTARLIRWLRMTRQDVLVVAVASAHSDEVEQLVRHAGAHCYLPQTDEVSLERAIVQILQQAAGGPGLRQLNDAHSRSRHRDASGNAVARQGA